MYVCINKHSVGIRAGERCMYTRLKMAPTLSQGRPVSRQNIITIHVHTMYIYIHIHTFIHQVNTHTNRNVDAPENGANSPTGGDWSPANTESLVEGIRRPQGTVDLGLDGPCRPEMLVK